MYRKSKSIYVYVTRTPNPSLPAWACCACEVIPLSITGCELDSEVALLLSPFREWVGELGCDGGPLRPAWESPIESHVRVCV